MIFWVLAWTIYGLIVGGIAKAIHSGTEPTGCFGTILVGVVGSYIGGFLNYVLFGTGTPFSPSGFIMGIVGSLILLVIYAKVNQGGK